MNLRQGGANLADDFAQQKVGQLAENEEESGQDKEPRWADFI